MLRKIFTTTVLMVIALAAWAQNGTIAGVVTDATTADPIIGASVLIQGTQTGATTDVEGKFTIPNVPPGTYTLTVTFITYTTAVVPDVLVESAKRTDLKLPLQEGSTELQEITITGTREMSTDLALINSIKTAKLVVSGIASEQIVKLPDADAAQVAQRIPGITVVDGRFVMVRGVPERYNQVFINDAIAPSTEVDRRSFSFDLIPSSAIDQLLIYKSGSPDLPGDFAGGVVRVITKQAMNDEYTGFGISMGYRVNTSFGDFYQGKTSSTDMLGFDNGFRGLPSGFPSMQELRDAPTRSQLRSDAGKSLENNFVPTKKTAPIDYGFNFSLARNLHIGRIEASNLTILNYSTSFQHYDLDYTRYNEKRLAETDPSIIQFDFDDQYSKVETKASLVHNWQFNIGDRSKIEFKNLLVQIGEDQTVLRTGYNNYEQVGKVQNNASFHYLARTIYTGQLQGTFKSADERNTYGVVFGANYIHRDEPDYRRYRRVKVADSEDPFEMILPPSSALIDAGRFYSELTDKGFSNGFNFEHKFGDVNAKRLFSVKAGYYVEKKDRDFSGRYVSYFYPATNGFPGELGPQLAVLPLDQIFSPNNMFQYNPDGSVVPGFSILEGTRPTDKYTGKNLYTAGYVMGNFPLGKFDLSGGFRLEYNKQELETSTTGENVEHIENPVTSPLPFINVAYNLSDRTLIRVAYSRTVNRPEFRELAPFLYYQFDYDANTVGNTELKTATIDNIDLRWEFYPNPGEAISVGGFYKSFKDPIEVVLQSGGLGQNFTYRNAPEAYTVGAEVEVRKSLSSLGVSRFLRNTSVNVNASVIQSEVDMGPDISFQARKRDLQGQSPYVINAALFYSDTENDFTVNLGYNIIGKRIMAVGSVITPTWWEMPRNSVDLQITKKIKRMDVKLNISNLLDAKYRVYQDDNDDEKIESSIDQLVRGNKIGQQISLGLGWKFAKE